MTMSVPTRLSRHSGVATVAAAAALTLLFQVSCADLNREALEREELGSGDSYTWLALLVVWSETGQWKPFVPAYNAPDGLETHLTRPFAAVVLGFSKVLAPWWGSEAALRVAGKLTGPVLQVGTAVTLALGARALLGAGGALLAVVGFLAMPLSSARFGVHNFDWHALHLFLTAVVVALLICGATGHARRQWPFGLAGAVAGIGIWTGTEMLIPAAIGALAVGLAWVVKGSPHRSRRLWRYALGMTLTLTVGLMVERTPSAWLSWDLDRLSAVHVLVALLLLAGSRAITWVEARWSSSRLLPAPPDEADSATVGEHATHGAARFGHAGRLLAAVAVAAGMTIAMWAAVPDFLVGPYGNPAVVVSDHLRGLSDTAGGAHVLGAAPWLAGQHLCILILVAGGVAAGLCTSRREAWFLVVVGLATGSLGTLYQYRLVQHYELFAAIALGGAVAGLGRSVWRRGAGRGRGALAALLLTLSVALASPQLGWWAGALYHYYAREGVHPFWEAVWRDRECDWRALGMVLASLPRQGGGNIVTYAGPGPELAHFSERGVVATGCHCNPEGMRDARAVLLSPAPIARSIAQRRAVEFVVQCPAARGWQGHEWYVERSGPEGLYGRLARDDPPDWLLRWPPEGASPPGAEGFVVWRTSFPK